MINPRGTCGYHLLDFPRIFISADIEVPIAYFIVGGYHRYLGAQLKVSVVSHHKFNHGHLVARHEILGCIIIKHLSVNDELTAFAWRHYLCANHGARMYKQIGKIPVDIVYQLEIADAVNTGLDGAVVVDRSADAARATEYALAKNKCDGILGVWLSAESTTQLTGLSSLTVVHHHHTSVEDAQRTAQIVAIASDGHRARTFFNNTEHRVVAIICGSDPAGQREVGIRQTEHIVCRASVLHIALQRGTHHGVQRTDAEARACRVGLGAERGALVQRHRIVL